MALVLQLPTSFGRSLERVCAPGSELEEVWELQAILSQGRGKRGGEGFGLVGREEAQDW